jgi:ClpP class serine protease
MEGFGQIFWLFILLSFMVPMLRQWNLQRVRVATMRSLERKRKSRVITLIHRQESVGFMGMFTRDFINIEDSEQVLRAIRMTSDKLPIDLIVHTPGGLLLAAEQIANALRKHPSKVTVFIPHYAMSGGTLIALAADEIVMDEHAVLGPVDPQLGQYPAASILRAVQEKPTEDLDDETLILADMSRKALHQTRNFVFNLLKGRLPDEKARELSETLTEGRWTHDYPIMSDEAKELGLPITNDLPVEICQLMRLYPPSGKGRPSVQYVPMPYPHNTHGNGNKLA